MRMIKLLMIDDIDDIDGIDDIDNFGNIENNLYTFFYLFKGLRSIGEKVNGMIMIYLLGKMN